MTVVLLLAAGFVAFTNGANANVKGVASLYGSGTATLLQTILWGTFCTFVGSVASLFCAAKLVTVFGGKGLVPDALVANPSFLTAVAIGGALTSFLATRFGFPVSTTHALVGALVGAGLAGGGEVKFAALNQTVLAPLFFSPFVAAVAGALLFLVLTMARLMPSQRTPTLDRLNWLTTGAASFARGLNDTPKMVALMVTVPGLGLTGSFLLVAVLIALGGLLDSKRVAETLGKKITGMTPGEGFAASLVTASLVTTASLHALPVSTTHVSVGSLFGLGAASGRVHWRKVGEILIVWLSTVPVAAVLAGIVMYVLR